MTDSQASLQAPTSATRPRPAACVEPMGPSGEREFAPGHVLDGCFLIEGTLSRGGMALIYRGVDLRDAGRRAVAIKVPLLRYESDPAFFGRFRREGEIGVRLRHPSLLSFTAPPANASRPYVVTEYLEGRTLEEEIHRRVQRPFFPGA